MNDPVNPIRIPTNPITGIPYPYIPIKKEPITGLYVGRLQPLHLGHVRIINQMLKECDFIIIVIGSVQEQGTEKNPFSYHDRKKMIKETFKANPEIWKRIFVFGLPDIFNSNRWSGFVLDSIKTKLEDKELNIPLPTVYYCGSEFDGQWFKNSGLEVKIVDRNDKVFPYISSSMIRNMCMNQDKRWANYVPSEVINIIHDELMMKYNWGDKL